MNLHGFSISKFPFSVLKHTTNFQIKPTLSIERSVAKGFNVMYRLLVHYVTNEIKVVLIKHVEMVLCVQYRFELVRARVVTCLVRFIKDLTYVFSIKYL